MGEEKTETVASRDGCVVGNDGLSLVLNVFVGAWEKTRPNEGHRFGKKPDVKNVRAVEWLSAESGVSERTIVDVIKEKSETTDLSVADALVAAVGCPEAFHDGRLEVSCCGGSTRR